LEGFCNQKNQNKRRIMTSKRQVLFAAAILLAAHSLQASDLFVANTSAGQIVEITPSGSQSIFASGLTNPEDIAFNGVGDLFVSGLSSGGIFEVTPQGAESTFAAGLSNVVGLAFDSAGNLYVDTGTEIDKFTPAGVKTTFVSGLPGSGLMGGMPFDALGNLYVTEQAAGEILQITPAGTVNVFASGLYLPSGLTMDSSGNLYFDDVNVAQSAGQIVKITPGGVMSLFLSASAGGLALNSAGTLFYGSGSDVWTVNQGVPSIFATGLQPIGLAFAPTTAAPEPSTFLLLVPTLGVILLRARRRRTA
jgi:sugar lactone lactonase YvrE